MTQYCILEAEVDSLPEHWTPEGITDDGRRVMEVFDDSLEAKDYIKSSYGMYRTDAVVESTDNLTINWFN